MLNKHLFFLLAISVPIMAMEIQEFSIQMGPEINIEELSVKLYKVLKSNDSTTKSIIKELLTTPRESKKMNPDLERQKAIIIRKLSESDE